MDVTVVETLVARQKQLNAELEAVKQEILQHEQAIEDLQAKGQPIFEEARSVGRELRIALGLAERAEQAAPQAEQPVEQVG